MSKHLTTRLRSALCLLAALWPNPSPAEEASPWRIDLDMEVVSIAPAGAPDLIRRLRESATFAAAYAELQKMIERDEAELVAWPVAVTQSRGRTVAESTVEERYVEQYDFDQLKFQIGQPLHPVTSKPGDWYLGPTVFYVRNAGVMLEADCTVSEDGRRIGLNVVPQRVRYLGDQTLLGVKLAGGNGLIEESEFLTAKTSGNITIHNGDRVLAGVFFESKPQPNVTLFLLKAAAMRIGEASSPP